jgi:uncharacterized protein (UPF0335 family)
MLINIYKELLMETEKVSIAFLPNVIEMRWRDKEYIAERFLENPEFTSPDGKGVYTGRAKHGFDTADIQKALDVRNRGMIIREADEAILDDRILFSNTSGTNKKFVICKDLK